MLDALSSRATRHRRSTGMLLILWLVDRDDVFGWHNRLRGRFLTPSGWPFRPEVTPFTYSFLVYPLFLVAALSRRYPLSRITATALVFGFTTFSHIYFETPFDQYRTWAEGSPVPSHGIQHTSLLNTESQTAGIMAATI